MTKRNLDVKDIISASKKIFLLLNWKEETNVWLGVLSVLSVALIQLLCNLPMAHLESEKWKWNENESESEQKEKLKESEKEAKNNMHFVSWALIFKKSSIRNCFVSRQIKSTQSAFIVTSQQTEIEQKFSSSRLGCISITFWADISARGSPQFNSYKNKFFFIIISDFPSLPSYSTARQVCIKGARGVHSYCRQCL